MQDVSTSYHARAMFHVILFQPEIPPNTGNLIRLCANAGATLHLVHPLGFDLSDAQVRRAGLDYHEMTSVREHADLQVHVPGKLLVSGEHRRLWRERLLLGV